MVYDFFSPLDAVKKIPSQKAEKNILESYDYLSNDFSSIEKMMREYNPLELMKLSLWDERKVLREKKKDQKKSASAVLMPVLLQSVLLSTYFTGYGSKRNISEKDWNRLKSISDDCLRRIIRIVENKTALYMADGAKTNEEGEKYRSIIASYLIPPSVTEESLKRDLTVLLSLFEEKWPSLSFSNVDPSTYEINIDNIAHKSLRGIDDLCSRVQAYSDEYAFLRAQKKDELENKSEDEIYRIITKENGWEGRAEALSRERDSFDLYTLDKLTSLSADDFKPFSAEAASLDIISLLKLGYWSAMRYPFFSLDGKLYTFVGKHIPRFIALSSSFSRREAALKDVSSIFFRTGIDTYTYDGNSIDISVLPSYYDTNVFATPGVMTQVEAKRKEELSLKASYGHKRLVIDPDMEEEMKKEGDSFLIISSAFMADGARNRNSKHCLIKSLLGDLDLPEKTSEYTVVDEDELANDTPSPVDDEDDKISDEYEYDNSDGDSEALLDSDTDTLPPEYEKKVVDIKKEEEKYALTDEIIAKEQRESEEEEKYTLDLDDDIFDDSEEEERLDDIGEKEEDEYYIEEENEEQKEEDKNIEDDGAKEDDDDGQLDFFDLLDEDDEDEKPFPDNIEKEDEDDSDYLDEEDSVLSHSPVLPLFDDDTPDEEEKEEEMLDEEIEKEDEEEFTEEEEKAEALDDSSFTLPSEETSPDQEEKEEEMLDEEIVKEDEEEFTEEEEKEEALDKGDMESLPSVDEEEKTEESVDEPFTLQNDENFSDDEEKIEESDNDSLMILPSSAGTATGWEQQDVSALAEDEEAPSELEEADLPDSANLEGDEEFTLPSLEEGEDRDGEGVSSEENEIRNTTSDWLSAFMGENGADDEIEVREEPPLIEEHPLDITGEEHPEDNTEDKEECSQEKEDVPEIEENTSIEDTEKDSVDVPPLEEEHQILTMEELEDEEVSLPLVSDDKNEDIPYSGIVREIYISLSSSSVFAEFLDDSGLETAEELEEVIRNSWEKSRNEGKDKLFNIAQYSISVIISHNLVKDELRKSELYNNAGGVMYSYLRDKWTAILLFIDDSFSLSDAYEKTLTKESFSPSDWKRVTYIGEQIKNKALNNG